MPKPPRSRGPAQSRGQANARHRGPAEPDAPLPCGPSAEATRDTAASGRDLADRLLHSLIDNLPGVVYRGHPDWSVSFLGGDVEQLTGRPATAYLEGTESWPTTVHPDDLHRVRETFRTAVRSRKRALRVEYRIRRPDGSVRWVADRRQMIYAGDGAFVHVDGVVVDITERKEAEEKVRDAVAEAHREKAKSDAILAAIGDGVTIQDRDFRILYQNETEKKIAGDHVGEPCYRAYEGNDGVCAGCPVERAFRDGETHFAERTVGRNGGTLHLELAASPLRNAEGKIVAAIEVVRDITRRRQMEKDRIRLETAVEQADQTIMITALDGTIQYVNPAFERLTGYKREEAIGQTPRFLSSGKHDEAFYRSIRETLGKGEVWTGHFLNRKKNGELFEEEATISPIRDSCGRIINYVASKRDVTRLVSLERQVRTAQRMESVGTMAGGIAHDFNNALTGIMGFAELLRMRVGQDLQATADLGQIVRAAERASALTRQLLAFACRQVIEPRTLSLNDVIADTAKLLRKVSGEHIEVQTLLSPDLPTVLADPGPVEQVLMNLCINARDAMPAGGRVVIATRVVQLEGEFVAVHPYVKPGRYVRLTVSDNGVGMDEETRERAFDPFFTTKERGKGTGLGLSVVYGIVKQHGGYVHLESEPGNGTTFTIDLPARKARPAARTEAAAAPVHGGTETILVAEDDDSIRMLVERAMTECGYTVLLARNGEEAVSLFRANPEIALAVLDVVMPKVGGMDAFQEMRQEDPELKVIFMSGYAADSIHDSFVLLDGVSFLRKPFVPAALTRKVREVLDSKAEEPKARGRS